MNESLESEAFVEELEEAVKSKKIKRKKDAKKKTFHDELLKLFEKSKKQFQTFQSEMLGKKLQSEAVEKQKDREFFFTILQNVRTG